MPSSIKVKFYVEKRKDAQGEIRVKNVPIIFSVSYGHRYVSFTGIRIDDDLWDAEKQRVTSSHTHAARYNKTLSDLKKELEDICLGARNKAIRITNAYISANLTMNKLKSKSGFFDYYDEWIEKAKKECQPGTITKYETIKNHLRDFAKLKQYKIEFDTLNDAFLNKFLDYYFDDKKFIKAMKDLPVWRLGKVRRDNVFKIHDFTGKVIVNTHTGKLKAAWQSPFKDM